MTTAERPGAAAIASLVSEGLTAIPGRARLAAEAALASHPASRAPHLVDATYAALLAGEPKRARELLGAIAAEPDGAGYARHAAALELWAAQLDRNWYPGDVGSEVPGPVGTAPPTEGHPETVLVEFLVTYGPVSLLTPRAVVDGLLGRGNTGAARQMAASAMASLNHLVEFATRTSGFELGLWARVAQAGMARRAGIDGAGALLGAVRQDAATVGMPGVVTLTHLVEGDWAATPGSSPEALGFDLGPRPAPSPRATAADLDRAAAAYAAAEEAATAAGLPAAAPALWAALHLRWATLAWLRHDHPRRRQHLEIATAAADAAGASALSRLLDVHVVIADLADGTLAATLEDVGSGWTVPAGGRLAALRRWAHSEGSTSWCAGCGRLLERAGDAWLQEGEGELASLAYLGALHLLRAEPALPAHTLMTAVAKIDADRNLGARALARMERLLTALPPLTDVRAQMFRFVEEIEILTGMVGAQRGRARTAAAQHAARGLVRIRDRCRALVDMARQAGIASEQPGTLAAEMARLRALVEADNQADLEQLLDAPGDSATSSMLATVVGAAESQLSLIDVLVPLSRGEHAEGLGSTDRADQWYAAALTAAGAASAPFLVPLVLIAADRRAEAREHTTRLAAEGTLADDLLALLALRADDHATAAAALARTGEDPATATDWRTALTGAELARGAGRPDRALELADHGIALFEAGMARLVRDTDRVAAADDPSAASLYMVATSACLELARTAAGTDDFRARAFAYTERARSLALDALLDEDGFAGSPDAGRWREAAATWAADVDRLLAGIDASPPADTRPLLAAADASEAVLRRFEAGLDRSRPGLLVRRARPRAPVELRSVQERLSPGTGLLEYHAIGDDLVVAAVTHDGIELARRPVRSRRLAALVRSHHARCSAGSGTGPEAGDLAGLLLDPVGDLVGDCGRLVVVPFGPLHSVPFHALPFRGAPLGRTRVLSYAPSAALGTAPDRPVPMGSGAVIGDPAFDPDLHPRLGRLPGARTEAHVVAARLGCNPPLTDAAATETAVRRLLPDRAVLHLATHGWLDEVGPYASSLVLAGRDSLVVAELVGLHLGARLAVLSACDTGRGAATLGGDVVGLTRALLAAGVRETVVSLWPVDDRTACVTMAAFYDALRRGEPPAPALTSAQGVVAGLDAPGLRAAYTELCREARTGGSDPGDADRRRSADDDEPADDEDELADDELADDEPLPAPLGGSAERHWAPFVLISAG